MTAPHPHSLSHLDAQGDARMIDIGDKPISKRVATAQAQCRMLLATAETIRSDSSRKGNVLQIARLAAISGAKRTDELIPLCHSVPLDSVAVEFQWAEPTLLLIEVTSAATSRTGVEMEALVGASMAALTVYDMCKSIDRSLRIEVVELVSKSGGMRGDYVRSEVNK